MKAGQKVLIKDGSWMLTIENGNLVHKKESGKYPGWFRNEFVIVEIGCVYPFDHPFKYADTIIQNIENGDIWFCNSAMNLVKSKSTNRKVDKFGEISTSKIKGEQCMLCKYMMCHTYCEACTFCIDNLKHNEYYK